MSVDPGSAGERAEGRVAREWNAVWLAVVVVLALAVYDVAAGPKLVLAGLLTVGPCIAATSGGRRAVAAVGAFVFGGILLLSWPDRLWWTLHQLLYLIAVVGITAVSVVVAGRREQQEERAAIAEGRLAELASQRAQSERLESLGQLAGGVAHDFNNLLGVILNYATLVGRRVDDPVATADLGEIRAAAERAAGLTQQLLAFARRDVVHPEPVDVNDLVRSVASMLERTLGSAIEFHFDLCDGPLVTVADRHQLEQTVLNLAINARDAMPAGGSLTISTDRPASDQARLRVTDTGHGMTAEVAARAFEPFFTTKAVGEGTGIGLATVHGIVRRAGGTVSIESVEGVGSSITIVLPCTDEHPEPLVPLDTVVLGHERILLVEDEAGLRATTGRILVHAGYEVVVACDGVEALEIFAADARFDLVLTDLAMPRMRGDELATRLAEQAPDLRVIVASGYDTGHASSRHRLAKPVSEEVLLRSVREVLDG